MMRFQSVILAAAMLIGVGCQTHPLTFRITDASTRRPMEGVRGELWITQDDILLGSGSKELTFLSDKDGIIRVPSLKKWNQRFDFRRDDYRSVRAFHGGTNWKHVIVYDDRTKRTTAFDERTVIPIEMEILTWTTSNKP